MRGGCRKRAACEALGLSLRTVQRWQRDGVHDRRGGTRAQPANRLSEAERAQVSPQLPQQCVLLPLHLCRRLGIRRHHLPDNLLFDFFAVATHDLLTVRPLKVKFLK